MNKPGSARCVPTLGLDAGQTIGLHLDGCFPVLAACQSHLEGRTKEECPPPPPALQAFSTGEFLTTKLVSSGLHGDITKSPPEDGLGNGFS